MEKIRLFDVNQLIITQTGHGEFQNYQSFDFTAHPINYGFINKCRIETHHQPDPYDSYLNIFYGDIMIQLVHAEYKNNRIGNTAKKQPHWHVAILRGNKWHKYLAFHDRSDTLKLSPNYTWKPESYKYENWDSYQDLYVNGANNNDMELYKKSIEESRMGLNILDPNSGMGSPDRKFTDQNKVNRLNGILNSAWQDPNKGNQPNPGYMKVYSEELPALWEQEIDAKYTAQITDLEKQLEECKKNSQIHIDNIEQVNIDLKKAQEEKIKLRNTAKAWKDEYGKVQERFQKLSDYTKANPKKNSSTKPFWESKKWLVDYGSKAVNIGILMWQAAQIQPDDNWQTVASKMLAAAAGMLGTSWTASRYISKQSEADVEHIKNQNSELNKLINQ